MNKKFLSAILFGALMVTSTGTFVSCKDYDDDIKDLQGQIDNLATKADVEARLTQLQAALDAAKAESAANAAKIAAIKQCQCDVDAMMKKIQDAVDADMAKYKEEIEALVKEVEALVGKVAEFVTSVELVASYTKDQTFPLPLNFYTITEQANTFEENIAGAITFEAGKETQVAKEPILVRVSPANAVLKDDMISLVNSQGQNIDEYVDVKVSKHNDLLTRAASNSGLWEVKATLKNKEAFEKISTVKVNNVDKQVLYAVQVNNTLSNAAERFVTSSYDVVMDTWTSFTPADTLKFTVDGVSVENINNRYTGNSLSLIEKKENAEMYAELAWKASTKDIPTPAVEAVTTGNKINVAADSKDDRSTKPVALAVQGKPLTIAIDKSISSQVKAIYVTLDKEANAIESAPSEWNAWKKYSYTGLNQVVEGTSTTITINGEETINDYIGFRVYAVNLDGTLVDPDGKAFYVLVGEQAQELNVVATSITPVNETLVATEAVAVEALAELTKTYKYSWSVDKDNQPFSVVLYREDGSTIGTLTNGKVTENAGNYYEDVAKIAAMPEKQWYEYEDGKTYTGTLTVNDETGFVVATLKVSFTKNIPTGAPAGFSIKTNQVVDGIYNCYLIPNDWAAEKATQGTMAMDQIFNIPADIAENFNISFANTNQDKDKKYTVAQTVAGDSLITIDVALIDNATKHATTATYNYGKISSAAIDKDKNPVDYVVTLPEVNFETVYNCIYNNTYSWAWATREQLSTLNENWVAKNTDGTYKYELPALTLTYGTSMEKVTYGFGQGEADIDQFIYGVSTKDSKYNAFLHEPYEGSLKVSKATFTSDVNGKQEYFEPIITDGHLVGLKALPETSNPEAAVASTLTITLVDMYKHEIVIKVAGTVNKR